MRTTLALALLAVVVAACAPSVAASVGDDDPVFQQCAAVCAREKCGVPEPEPLPFYLRLLWWDCPEDCRYNCMQKITDRRVEAGEGMVQYFGKWPFYRVFGVQEIASTVFSVLNGVPHFLNRKRWRQMAPRGHYMARVGVIYSWIGMNCWLWSAAFHARDNVYTERLDYHCASLMLLFSGYVGLVRTLELRNVKHQTILGCIIVGLLALHVAHMNLVEFDYGWNMKVSIIVVLFQVAVWIVHNVRNPRSYSWKAYAVIFLTIAAALMEVYDFPPFFYRTFDAHSLWHGATVPLGFLWYGYLLDDLQFEMRREAKSKGFNGDLSL